MRINVSMVLIAACLAAAFASRADTPYTSALKEGDEHARFARYEEAMKAYGEAERKGATPTEQALAKGKRAHVLAYRLNRHDQAIALADDVLKLRDLKPVAEVTARMVRAYCLMKDGEWYEQAAIELNQALELEGVEWSRPELLLLLGDCYRLGGRPEQALHTYRRLAEDADMNDRSRGVAWQNIGMTHQYNLRQKDPAREAYRKAIVLNPDLESGIDVHLESL